MSFEGYYQVICKNGHYHLVDVFEYPIFEENDRRLKNSFFPYIFIKCPECDELTAWYNLVNITNGSYCSCNPEYSDNAEGCEFCDHGRIDGYVDLKESEDVYKIPQDKGVKVNVT